MRILQDDVCEVSTLCLESTTTLAVINGDCLVLRWSNNWRPHPSPLALSDGSSYLGISKDSGCHLALDLATTPSWWG